MMFMSIMWYSGIISMSAFSMKQNTTATSAPAICTGGKKTKKKGKKKGKPTKNAITGDQSKQDQILLVKIAKYIGF